MSASARLRRTGPLVGLALGCVALVVFAHQGSLGNELHLEDVQVVQRNAAIQSLGNVGSFFADVSTPASAPALASYRPLLMLSLALDIWAGGGSLRALHAGQILLLVLFGAAVAWLCERLMRLSLPGRWNRTLALGTATFVSVHVANTEALAVMAARADLLGGIGLASGLALYLSSARARRRGLYLLPMALGALGSTQALALAPLLFVLVLLAQTRWYAGAPSRAKLRRSLRVAAPALVAALLLAWLIGTLSGKTPEPGLGARVDYALTQPWAWLHYLRLFVLPAGLSVQSDLASARLHDTQTMAGLAAGVGLVLVAWRAARTRAGWPIAFGLAWFVITLLPTSSLQPQAQAIAERRVLVPYIGLSLAVVWALRLSLPRVFARFQLGMAAQRALACGLCGVLLGAHTLGTRLRHRVWRTAESLWADATQKSPQQAGAWMSYGLALMARNELAGARASFERALALWPGSVALEINLGIVLGALGSHPEAEAHHRRAIEIGPGEHLAHFYYGRWLLERGRGPEALARLEQAARLAPGDAGSHAALMDLHAAIGDTAGASHLARQWLTQHPEDARARAHAGGTSPLGLTPPTFETYMAFGLAQLDRDPGGASAALAFREAARIRPASAEAWNDVGFALSRMGFLQHARAALITATRLRPDLDLARNNLAWVTAELARRAPAPTPGPEAATFPGGSRASGGAGTP